jgi:hypothetical protein
LIDDFVVPAHTVKRCARGQVKATPAFEHTHPASHPSGEKTVVTAGELQMIMKLQTLFNKSTFFR